jgi:hypothetical protein
VCVDQLPEPHSRITQAEWLSANGIDVLLASARSHLESNPGLGDLDAIRARSTILEAEALTEPGGLGGFLVLEWSAASG